MIKMNEELISKSIEDVSSSILELCEKDLSYLQLTSKIDAINTKLSELEILMLYSKEKHFDRTISMFKIISSSINTEIENNFGKSLSHEFKEQQLNFLRNVSNVYDISIQNSTELNSCSEDIKSSFKKKSQKKIIESKEDYSKKISTLTVDDIIKETNKNLDMYFESEKDIKELLDFMSKFYNYSMGNCSLIESQFPGAVAVGSFNFWNKHNFKVKKGEKGIRILVPFSSHKFIDENGVQKYISQASDEQKQKIKNGILKEIKSKKLLYKKGYVFDISQTDATLDDLPKLFPNRWLDEKVNNYDKIFEACEYLANKIGVKIIDAKSELGVAKGVSYTLTKEVALNPRNGELQNIKTLIHELAHAKLHHATSYKNYSHEEKEFEAEMVAYTVCKYFNLDTSEYSLSYLNHYTKNNDIRERKKLLNEVKETSKEFISIISETLENTQSLEFEKALENNNIYAKFTWTEFDEIEDGSIYQFNDACELIDTYNNIINSRGDKKAYTGEIGLYFDESCTDKFLSFPFEINNELNNIDYYIQQYIDDPASDISQLKKNSLSKILIKDSMINKSINNELDL